jgi:hypothetical protein
VTPRALAVPLLRGETLSDAYPTSRSVSRALGDDEIRRVRPGVYVPTTEIAELTREERAVVRMRALTEISATRPVASHLSATAMHGLPLWDVADDDRCVHVIVSDERPGRAVNTVRHRGALPDDDLVEIEGMLCTSLARTVADIARTALRTTAACISDAAFRTTAWNGPGDYRADEAESFRERVVAIAHRSAHGVSKADRVLSFADGRAQLPGESVSRLHLATLGFAAPSLQVRVAAPREGSYWVDFGLDDVAAFGEFDGKGKYRDVLMRQGLTMEDALDREKQREDWIRGTTGRRLVRWSTAHIRDAATLGARLAAFGISPP